MSILGKEALSPLATGSFVSRLLVTVAIVVGGVFADVAWLRGRCRFAPASVSIFHWFWLGLSRFRRRELVVGNYDLRILADASTGGADRPSFYKFRMSKKRIDDHRLVVRVHRVIP